MQEQYPELAHLGVDIPPMCDWISKRRAAEIAGEWFDTVGPWVAAALGLGAIAAIVLTLAGCDAKAAAPTECKPVAMPTAQKTKQVKA